MLISIGFYYGQTAPMDTLKSVNADTLISDELESQIQYSALDSLNYYADTKTAVLYKDAVVLYGNLEVKAAVIEINYEANVITAYGVPDSTGKLVGNPEFKEGDQVMTAEKIMYNLKTKKGKIFKALTKQGELLVFGNEIKKDSNDVVYLKNMKCIPCDQEDSRTVFRANKAKIIPNDKIVTGPMFLEVGGVPTPLGLPFGYFPNTKKAHSGILIPFVGNSPGQGFFL
ncbi:MAG: putative LPS assembly protein LptD, partial [Bacteroidia bacterium]